MNVHIGIDVGGTFTDIVILDPASGQLELLKVPSTKPATQGIIDGLQLAIQTLGTQAEAVTRLVHGSTVATNAILEGKWAKTALLTTEGFRDVLEIGRQNRPSLYDLSVDRPAPLVPRSQRFGISERLDFQGHVLKALDTAQVNQLIPLLREVESIAVCFLFSYLNPTHEQQVRSLLGKELNVPISLSSEILPDYREPARTATTVMSAALRPVVGHYLEELDDRVRELKIAAKLQVMQSNAGIVSTSQAARQAVQMLFSGPAGGVEGARFIGHQAGLEHLITFDMGGTSTDVALVQKGNIAMKTEGAIEGRPVRTPMVDIHSIGAGGGSLAWIDAGRSLCVGPQSAGSDPGPACYGKGEKPTVTDAQLLLGRLAEKNVLGGRTLNRERAERAIFDMIAQPSSLSLEEAASGILEIADAQMERAIRVITVQRGHDPRKFALLAFGGAGPMHAGALAERLSIPTVIVPPVAGVLSALGLLVADCVIDLVQTFIQRADGADLEKIDAHFARMRLEAETRLRHEPVVRVEFSRTLEMRYRGQSYELPVELGEERLSKETLAEATQRFHLAHSQLYGYAMRDRPIEIVNLHLRAIGRTAKPALRFKLGKANESSPVHASSRQVYFWGHGWLESQIWLREHLKPGEQLRGPVVIEGRESTVVLMPGQFAKIDAYENVIIESEGAR
ncbi:hydantoinase/oxoprolinase family protein [Candidatus Acetothermia bacterium]|nr:hydantoinase/oxoprolinase family protein [Candidatus Acetothermia bacterium]